MSKDPGLYIQLERIDYDRATDTVRVPLGSLEALEELASYLTKAMEYERHAKDLKPLARQQYERLRYLIDNKPDRNGPGYQELIMAEMRGGPQS